MGGPDPQTGYAQWNCQPCMGGSASPGGKGVMCMRCFAGQNENVDKTACVGTGE